MKPVVPCECGEGCIYDGAEDEPCWGNVTAVDEREMWHGDYGWIHACEGHADKAQDCEMSYKPPPKD